MTEEHSQPQVDNAINEDIPVESHNEEVTQQEQAQSQEGESHDSEKTVPLSVVQKERKKRQQVQEERDYYKKLSEQKPVAEKEEDYSRYESVTREDLGKTRYEIKREVQEEYWLENHPDRQAIIDTELEDFLKQRPNLAPAIQNAPNRYKEAWELMNALNPKQKAAIKSAPDKQAPHAPGTIPKAASLNQAMDVMKMSDSEFRTWAKSKHGRR